MIDLVLKSVWYFLPAYIANMVPVFATYILKKKFSMPIDFNVKIYGEPLLGKNKTWRGLFTGTVFGIAFAMIQKSLYYTDFFRKISIVNYPEIDVFMFGLLMCFGALFGDSLKSFFKRRLKIKPGEKWLPFDNIDFILGGLLFPLFIIFPGYDILLAVLIISPIVKIMAEWIGERIGILQKM